MPSERVGHRICIREEREKEKQLRQGKENKEEENQHTVGHICTVIDDTLEDIKTNMCKKKRKRKGEEKKNEPKYLHCVNLYVSGGGPAGCYGEGETGTGGDESQAVINSTLTGWEGGSPDFAAGREAEAPGRGPGDEVRRSLSLHLTEKNLSCYIWLHFVFLSFHAAYVNVHNAS